MADSRKIGNDVNHTMVLYFRGESVANMSIKDGIVFFWFSGGSVQVPETNIKPENGFEWRERVQEKENS